jgi:hypothetical protein
MIEKRKDNDADYGKEKSSDAEEYPVSFACPCNPRALASWISLGSYKGPSYLYNEPVQGCCGDCYFVAALSSVAWAAPGQLNNYPTITFRDPATGLNSSVTLTSDNLPVDAANALIYARSSSGKTWPMVYEKAFATWKKCSLIGDDPDHPDISLISGGAGIHGLISVSRYARKAEFSTAANNILTSIPKNPAGKTLYPSVAWTHDLISPPTGILNDHTYSILGFYLNNVVLRNPVTSMAEPGEAVKNGIWNAAPGVSINLTIANDGIFALSTADFNKYFYGFGYVNP